MRLAQGRQMLPKRHQSKEPAMNQLFASAKDSLGNVNRRGFRHAKTRGGSVCYMNRGGFTLIELLRAMGFLSVMTALLLPAVLPARELGHGKPQAGQAQAEDRIDVRQSF